MSIVKRPCADCPFRNDGKGIALEAGRLESIVRRLKRDDQKTFLCHKTLDAKKSTCAGALGVMHKLGRLPIVGRLGLAVGLITQDDLEKIARMVIETASLDLSQNSKKASNKGT